MASLDAGQQQKLNTYLAHWFGSALPTISDTSQIISLTFGGNTATIEVLDLLEGLEIIVKTEQTDPDYALIYQSQRDNLWRCEVPIMASANINFSINAPSGSVNTFKTGPSSVFIIQRHDLVKKALKESIAVGGSSSSVFSIPNLKYHYIETQSANRDEAINMAKTALAWLGQVADGMPLSLLISKEDPSPTPVTLNTHLPQMIDVDCRLPLDYYLYGISARRRMTSYLAFYHVLEYYMGEVEIQTMRNCLVNALSGNQFASREFCISFTQEYSSYLRRLDESQQLLLSVQRLPNDAVFEIIKGGERYIRNYTTDYQLPHLGEVLSQDRKRLKNQSEWRFDIVKQELSTRIYRLRNALLHAKSGERSNISLRTFEASEWPLFDIAILRHVAYYLLRTNVATL